MKKSLVNKEKVLSALLSSMTRKEAAEKSGISERTIYAYLQDPEFKERYEVEKRALLNRTGIMFQKSMQPAIQVLHDIANDKEAGNASRIQAARSILEYGIKAAELIEVYKRMDEIENKLEKTRVL